jgi:hypothetical protein
MFIWPIYLDDAARMRRKLRTRPGIHHCAMRDGAKELAQESGQPDALQHTER